MGENGHGRAERSHGTERRIQDQRGARYLGRGWPNGWVLPPGQATALVIRPRDIDFPTDQARSCCAMFGLGQYNRASLDWRTKLMVKQWVLVVAAIVFLILF